MPDGWRRIRLGEVASLDIERVIVSPTERYRVAGVLNAGRGLFERDAVLGADTNYPALHRLRTGQLVMRKLTAWEGPITTVRPEFDGLHVSPEFPTFTLSPDVLPSYMALVCQMPWFWEAMKDHSKGTVQRRKRVNPAELERIEVDLPPLTHQRRTVDLIAHLDNLMLTIHAAADETRSAADALRADWFTHRELTARPLRDFVEVTNGRLRNPANASGPHMTRYIRTANVKDARILLDEPMYMNFTPRERAKYRLEPGDVLVTEGSGSRESIGASARWDGQVPGAICFQNHLLRLRTRDEQRTPQALVYQWALWSFRTGRFADLATGTNILSLGVGNVESMPYVEVSGDDATRFLATVLPLDTYGHAATFLLDKVAEARGSLLSDLLSGGHDIPEGYDRFLEATA